LIFSRYGNPTHYPQILGIEPVNEPMDHIPWMIIEEYYYRAYQLMRIQANTWLMIFHDSFRLGSVNQSAWLHIDSSSHSNNNNNNPKSILLQGCSHYLIDIHLYQAWSWDTTNLAHYLTTTCQEGNRIREIVEEYHQYGIRVIIGEWSLAVDNCAMWLNGLNDNGKILYIYYIYYIILLIILFTNYLFIIILILLLYICMIILSNYILYILYYYILYIYYINIMIIMISSRISKSTM
jgi:hypothetical protein